VLRWHARIVLIMTLLFVLSNLPGNAESPQSSAHPMGDLTMFAFLFSLLLWATIFQLGRMLYRTWLTYLHGRR